MIGSYSTQKSTLNTNKALISFCPLNCDTHSAYTVFDALDGVQEIWSALLPDNHPLAIANLRVLEKTQPEAIQFRYIIVQDKQSNPIGCIYLQMLHFNAKHYNHDILNKPNVAHIKSYLIKQHTNILICGNLFRMNFQGFYFPKDSDRPCLLGVLKHFAKNNSAKIKFSTIFIKDCLDELPATTLKENRFKNAPKDIAMQITLRDSWQSFADYKADLSRKYVQRANKIITAKTTLTQKEFTLENIIDNAALLEQLYLHVALKQDVKMGLLNGQYFVEMKRNLQNNFSVVGYYLEDKLLAFSSYIFDNDAMEIHYIGIDYEYNDTYKIYFNILFDGLQIAIQQKKKTIALGRTTKDAKASAGATPILINNYFWLKLGIPTLAFNFLYKWYNSQTNDGWKKRDPFRVTGN